MPRLAQLLAALLITLIGVLIMQMLLLAGLQRWMAADPPPPPAARDTMLLSAPVSDPPLTAVPDSPRNVPQAPTARQTLVVIITPLDPTPMPRPPRMIDLSDLPPGQPVSPNDGKELIERFIALTSRPSHDSQTGTED